MDAVTGVPAPCPPAVETQEEEKKQTTKTEEVKRPRHVVRRKSSRNDVGRPPRHSRFGSNRPDYVPSAGKLRVFRRLYRRSWTRGPPSSKDLTFCSYNVLADVYIERGLYPYCPLVFLFGERRTALVCAEIARLAREGTDVFALQEVQTADLETVWRPLLEERLGFDVAFKAKTGVKKDGSLLAWRREKLRSVARPQGVEFKEWPTEDSRDNVALFTVLESLHAPNVRFVVATTHLLFNFKRSDIKLGQVCMLCRALADFRSTHGETTPVVLLGDLNATPDSELVRFLREGELAYTQAGDRRTIDGMHAHFHRAPTMSGGDQFLPEGSIPVATYNDEDTSTTVRQPFRFVDTQQLAGVRGPTQHHGQFRGTVDHILVHDPQRVLGTPHTGLQHPSDRNLDQTWGLPNEIMGSDHMPVLTTFRKKNKTKKKAKNN